MTGKLIAFMVLPMLAGCLTASNPKIAFWPVEYRGGAAEAGAKPKFGTTRVSSVIVRAPYGERNMAVLRANGSIAFDDLNEFAAQPVLLMKGMVADAMRGSGLFADVIGASSAVHSDVSVEVVVRRLALDCRTEGSRRAVAETLVRVVRNGELAAIAKGEGEADAADGNYGAAFGTAISSALDRALAELK